MAEPATGEQRTPTDVIADALDRRYPDGLIYFDTEVADVALDALRAEGWEIVRHG